MKLGVFYVAHVIPITIFFLYTLQSLVKRRVGCRVGWVLKEK